MVVVVVAARRAAEPAVFAVVGAAGVLVVFAGIDPVTDSALWVLLAGWVTVTVTRVRGDRGARAELSGCAGGVETAAAALLGVVAAGAELGMLMS